jgi:hypothetical protein
MLGAARLGASARCMALTTWRAMSEKPTLIEYVIAALMGVLTAVVGYYWVQWPWVNSSS